MNDLIERVKNIGREAIRNGQIDLDEDLNYHELIGDEKIPSIERAFNNMYGVNGECARLMIARTLELRAPYRKLARRKIIGWDAYVNTIRQVEFQVCAEFGILPVHSNHYVEKFGVEVDEMKF